MVAALKYIVYTFIDLHSVRGVAGAAAAGETGEQTCEQVPGRDCAGGGG